MEPPSDDLSAKVPVLAGVAGPDSARRARNWRRAGVALMAIVVLVACLGWLGPRETTSTDRAGGMAMTVTHPQISRSGVDSAIDIAVERDDSGPVVLEMDAAAFEDLGLETIVPTPASETVRGDTLVLRWAGVPAGDVTLRLLGRMSTRSTIGRVSTPIRVSAGDASPLEVTVRTWVLP